MLNFTIYIFQFCVIIIIKTFSSKFGFSLISKMNDNLQFDLCCEKNEMFWIFIFRSGCHFCYRHRELNVLVLRERQKQHTVLFIRIQFNFKDVRTVFFCKRRSVIFSTTFKNLPIFDIYLLQRLHYRCINFCPQNDSMDTKYQRHTNCIDE